MWQLRLHRRNWAIFKTAGGKTAAAAFRCDRQKINDTSADTKVASPFHCSLAFQVSAQPSTFQLRNLSYLLHRDSRSILNATGGNDDSASIADSGHRPVWRDHTAVLRGNRRFICNKCSHIVAHLFTARHNTNRHVAARAFSNQTL